MSEFRVWVFDHEINMIEFIWETEATTVEQVVAEVQVEPWVKEVYSVNHEPVGRFKSK